MSRTFPRPDAMIFDLDGTLLDTEPLYSDAAQKVLDEYGETYTLELKRQTMGGDSYTSAQIVIDAFGLPLTADEYLAKREAHLIDLFRQCPEIEGAGDFIARLHSAGVTIGLATSSHHYLRDIKLGGRRWAGLFHATVCGDNPALGQGKPAPDIFLLCANELGIAPEKCLAFEDSRNGVTAARAAGMTVIGIDSPWVSPGDLAEASATVANFIEATALFDWLE